MPTKCAQVCGFCDWQINLAMAFGGWDLVSPWVFFLYFIYVYIARARANTCWLMMAFLILFRLTERHLPPARQPRRSKPFEHLANICALLSSWRGSGAIPRIRGARRGRKGAEGKSTTSWRQLRLHKCMRRMRCLHLELRGHSHLHFCGGLAQLPMAFGQVIAACCCRCRCCFCCRCCSCHCCCCPNTTEVLKTFQCQVLAI